MIIELQKGKTVATDETLEDIKTLLELAGGRRKEEDLGQKRVFIFS